MDDALKQQLRLAGYTGQFGLSELIEACGEDFDYLKKVGTDKWAAMRRKSDDGFVAYSKEEAVARLWLALNKKP